MKKLLIVALLYIHVHFTVQKSSLGCVLRLNKINCSASGKTITIGNLSCTLENSVNVKDQKNILIESYVMNPIFKGMVNFYVQYRSNSQSEYHTLVNNTLNGCAFLNGTEKNPAGKWLINQVSGSLPKGSIHSCPYYGNLKWNFTIKPTKGIIFSPGLMKISYKLFNEDDSNMFTLKLDGILS